MKNKALIDVVIVIGVSIAAFLASDPYVAIACFALPAALLGAYIGPGFAIVQSHIPLEMRSVAAAINLFIGNIIGLGVGPFTVGLISDLAAPAYGVDSLRYGLLAMTVVLVWSAVHYLRVALLLPRSGAGSSRAV